MSDIHTQLVDAKALVSRLETQIRDERIAQGIQTASFSGTPMQIAYMYVGKRLARKKGDPSFMLCTNVSADPRAHIVFSMQVDGQGYERIVFAPATEREGLIHISEGITK